MSAISITEKRFQRSLKEGNFYEAEQACRSLYHRLMKSGREAEAQSMLEEGCRQLLKVGEINSGTALALMLAKHVTNRAFAGMPQDQRDKDREALTRIVDAYPPIGDLRSERMGESVSPETLETLREERRFLDSVIKWSSIVETVNGSSVFHARAGKVCWKMGDYLEAQKHFIQSDDPQTHAQMLLSWINRDGLKSDADLFMLRTIFKYLVTMNLKDANFIHRAFAAEFGEGFSPLVNFADLLLRVLERDNYALFNMLREEYRESLSRDPTFESFLTKIAAVFYNAQPPNSGGLFGGMSGIMGDMMRGMLGGGPGVGGPPTRPFS
mmetsp:Transcript_10148/g.20504  ORF Transcript_10148/g.20504 Transcript_10148/m.20504 type:complete len:325 (-) Transcript_10148:255-1229(-)